MDNGRFGFFEAVGSIILLLIDPNRRDNKKYLNPKYSKANRIVGIVSSAVLLGIGIYYLAKLIVK